MNGRERFLEVMNGNPRVAPLKWEFGYWGGTINNWYAQGLPRKRYPEIPTEITTPTSTLYTAAWTCQGTDRLPEGFPVMAGGLDEILEPVQAVLKTGGYIPFGDHFIPPEVPWAEFKYYRTKLNQMIDAVAG